MSGNERNKLCFCGSGLKYKKCHLLIDETRSSKELLGTRNLKQYEIQKMLDETLYPKYCLARELDGKCSDQIINAHTLTKSLSLSAIENNGHVFTFQSKKFHQFSKDEGRLSLRKQGIRTASTFKGFCSYHDNEIFSCLEKINFEFTEEQNVVLFYRSLALELYKKKSSLELARKSFSKLLNSFDKDSLPFGSELLTANLQRSNLDYKDMFELNEIFIKILKNKDYSRIKSYAIKLDNRIPFVCTGLFAIYKDIKDNIIQDIFDYTNLELNYTALNIFYAKNGTPWIILSWLDVFDSVNLKLIQQLQKLSIRAQVNVLSNLMLLYTENCYFSAEYIDNLNSLEKNKFEKIFNDTISLAKFSSINDNNFNFIDIKGEVLSLNL